LVAYEEAAKRVNNLMGHDQVQACWCAGSVAILLWMFKGHAFVDVYGQIARP
jgi:hypothetical protein